MKRYFCLFLVTLMIATCITGCGGGTSNGDGSTSEVLYHSIGSEPFITLDPSAENSNGIYILQNVYETLTRYNHETNELEPLLATEWSKEADGTIWEFKLREGVTFHDGTPMDAAAVKKSIDRTMSMNKGASYIWSAVETIEVVDEMTVKFYCSMPVPIDLVASAGYAAYIISDDACNQDSDWFNSPDGNDGGTGPYTVKSLITADQVVLEAYEGYWRDWKEGSFKNVILKKSIESSARRQLLESGDAHIADNFSTTDLRALKNNTDLDVIYETTYDNIIIFLNTQKYPVDNVDFRRALAYAFPYQEVVEDALENLGAQSVGLVPPGLWGHSDDLMQYNFDLVKAKEYLDKSGVDVSNLKLEFAIQSGTSSYRDLAQLWQVYLKQIGIEIEIRERNWDSHWEYAKATDPNDRQDMFIMIWWPDYASPISWFQSMVLSEDEVFFNLSYIKNPALDEKITEAERYIAVDRDKAEQMYIEIQEVILDQAYMIFPYDRVVAVAVSKSISGYGRSPAYPTAIPYFEITKAN